MTILPLDGGSTSNISDPSLAPYMDKAWALVFLANVCITVFAVRS